jgi:hypothetical protein
MEKKKKLLISSVTAFSTVAGIVAPSVTVLADDLTALEAAQNKVDYAAQVKTFYDFNMAYAATLALPAESQPALLAQLAAIESDCKSDAVQAVLTKMDELATTGKDLSTYTALEAMITEDVPAGLDQDYLYSELTDWGKGMVYTSDVTAAIDAVNAAWADQTSANVIAARTATEAVENEVSKAWLNDQIDEIVDGMDLFVESVESINAAQIQVTFSKALTEDDIDEADDLDNYTLNDEDGDEIDDILADVDAEEGSNIVTLTVDYDEIGDDDEDYQNQGTFELVIDDAVTGTEESATFEVSDFTSPEVLSAEVVGIRTIKLIFSEPVVLSDEDDDLEDIFEVNDGDYSIDEANFINNNTEVNVVLYSDIEDGEELTVDISADLEDYAGYSNKKASFDITADFDDSDLEIVSYKDASDYEVTLVFNKDVEFADYEDYTQIVSSAYDGSVDDEDDDYYGFEEESSDSDTIQGLYHSSSKNVVEAVEIDGNEVTLYFDEDTELPETAYVYVDSDVLQDLYEVENDDLYIKVSATKDTTKPTIESVEQDEDEQDQIIITFSEDMDEDTAEDEDNYTVTDEDGDTVRISKAELTDDDEVTLTLSKDLDEGDTYEVTVEDVEDEAGNKISDTTESFVAGETDAVDADDLTLRHYNDGKSTQKIVVDFDTTMLADGTRYAINNLDNYYLTVKIDSTYYGVTLSDYDSVSIKATDSNSKVEIKLPGNDADNDESFDFSDCDEIYLTITQVKDDYGNGTNATDFVKLTVDGSDDSLGLDDEDETPVATDTDTIVVELEDEFSFDKDDMFIGYYEGDTLDEDDWVDITPSTTKVTKDGTTTITYTLSEDDEMTYDAKTADGYTIYVRTVDADEIESENSYGDTLAGDQTWKVMDDITPALALIDGEDGSKILYSPDVVLDDRDDYEDAVVVTEFNDNGSSSTATVTLTFEEDLTDANISKYVFETDDDDVDITAVSLSENVITLTLSFDSDDFADEEDLLGLGISTGTNKLYDTAEDGPDGVNGFVLDTEIEGLDVD